MKWCCCFYAAPLGGRWQRNAFGSWVGSSSSGGGVHADGFRRVQPTAHLLLATTSNSVMSIDVCENEMAVPIPSTAHLTKTFVNTFCQRFVFDKDSCCDSQDVDQRKELS